MSAESKFTTKINTVKKRIDSQQVRTSAEWSLQKTITNIVNIHPNPKPCVKNVDKKLLRENI